MQVKRLIQSQDIDSLIKLSGLQVSKVGCLHSHSAQLLLQTNIDIQLNSVSLHSITEAHKQIMNQQRDESSSAYKC